MYRGSATFRSQRTGPDQRPRKSLQALAQTSSPHPCAAVVQEVASRALEVAEVAEAPIVAVEVSAVLVLDT